MCPKMGYGIVQKTRVFGGLIGQRWVKKWHFLAKEMGKKARFLPAEREKGGRGRFFGPEADKMS
jgi:hypothetical protein